MSENNQSTNRRKKMINKILHVLPMSNAGRPVLLKHESEEEVEVCMYQHVSIYEEETESECNDGQVILTTLRILYVNTSHNHCYYLELKDIHSVEKKNRLFASPKIKINFNTAYGAQLPSKYILLSFRKGGRDEFLAQLETQLKRKNWIAYEEKRKSLQERNMASSQKQTKFDTKSAGLTGIINRVESQNKATEKKLSEAFSDLNSLMDMARDMVDLAEKFSEKIKKQQTTDSKEQDELDDVLTGLGLSSVVTKKSAGNLFHQQLARQLAEFLPVHLAKSHGIMALTDAYCLYNRARGTDLISPDDMYRACSLFDKLNLPIVMKKFESGVIVIQSSDATDEKIAERIAQLVESSAAMCVSAVDVAQIFKISVVLAQQQLTSAENTGILCRDESIEGVRFYLTSVVFGQYI
jgi:ESCRT-II complex subunit VPS36